MEVIADELRKNNVDVDVQILSPHINYVLARHGQLYDEMAERLGPEGSLDVFGEMNVNSFGRAMAYLTLIYLMDIPEDVMREAVRLVAPVLRDVGITRVEEGVFRRMFSEECFLGSDACLQYEQYELKLYESVTKNIIIESVMFIKHNIIMMFIFWSLFFLSGFLSRGPFINSTKPNELNLVCI